MEEKMRKDKQTKKQYEDSHHYNESDVDVDDADGENSEDSDEKHEINSMLLL